MVKNEKVNPVDLFSNPDLKSPLESYTTAIQRTHNADPRAFHMCTISAALMVMVIFILVIILARKLL